MAPHMNFWTMGVDRCLRDPPTPGCTAAWIKHFPAATRTVKAQLRRAQGHWGLNIHLENTRSPLAPGCRAAGAKIPSSGTPTSKFFGAQDQ